MTKDGGANWTDVSEIPGMPKDRCISRVEPSHFDEGTCYVSITRYRNDDRKPYIFKTTDYGETWDERHRQLAGKRQRPRRHRIVEEQEPAVLRHRVRPVRLARRRQSRGSR